jgi:hypothetical protein
MPLLKLAGLDSVVQPHKKLMNGLLAYICYGQKHFGGFLTSLLHIVRLTFKKVEIIMHFHNLVGAHSSLLG